MLKFYPSDTSFNRITKLVGKPFDFGAPVATQAQDTSGGSRGGSTAVALDP